MQEVDHPESPGDEWEYWMLSTRYAKLRGRSRMWEDIVIPHFTQSEFRIISMSAEVFQTMQSLPGDEDSASAGSRRERRKIAPKTSQCFAQVCFSTLCTACSTGVHPPKMNASRERELDVSS